MKDLENNKTDLLAAILKGAVGFFPFVGQALAEAISIYLPKQRTDRLVRFYQELASRVSYIEEVVLMSRLSNPERLEILTEGALNASRAVSNDRISLIVNMVANGISNDQIDFSSEIHFLRILSELTDVEVIILRSYLFKGIDDYDIDFKNKYKGIYSYPAIFASLSQEEREPLENQTAIQISYRVHLTTLGLLYQTNQAEINRSTIGPPRPIQAKYAITYLGKILLERIGLVTDEDKSHPSYRHIAPQHI